MNSSVSVEIEWSSDLGVTRTHGASTSVSGRSSAQLSGLDLASALGTSLEEAATLMVLEPGHWHFVRGGPLEAPRWLRVERLFEEAGAARFCVLDLEATLSGAPPLQIARIASSLSHELRNPLSSIKLAVQTLSKNTQLSARDQRRLTIANREVRTMERMLALLSEYGRDLPPKLESVALRTVVLEAVAMVELELSERALKVSIPTEDPAFPRVRADANRLRTVLAQLVLNVAAGCVEGSTMEVRLGRRTGEVVLALTDPTAELPAHERAVVFEPFGTFLARSAGLSLAALHRVMRGLGGEVRAEPAAPGTTYSLSFPV